MRNIIRRLLLCALALLAFCSGSFAQVVVPLNDANIRYIGRWDRHDPALYHSYWGGAYFRLRFTGTTLKLKLAAATSLAVGIDGGEDRIKKAGGGIVDLTPGRLGPGEHMATIAANWQTTELQLQSVLLDPGARTLPPTDDPEIIEFVGDSITTGDRTKKGDISAYPWLIGKLLNCQHTQISFCGITLTDGFHYNYHGAPQRGMSVAYFLSREPHSDPNPTWDFVQYTPSVVVINLGTNDHSCQVPEARVTKTYSAFVTEIRSKFPKAVILALRPFRGFYATEIQQVVQERANAKDIAIHFVDTEGWITKSDTSDGTHPTDAGHAIVAAKLAPIIKSYLIQQTGRQ
jgi:hypothetical protein